MPPTVVRGCSKTWGHGHIGVPEITLIVPTLLRGNAAQDAPRPILNVAQSFVGGMPTRSDGRDQCRWV